MERRSAKREKRGNNAFTPPYAADAFRNVGAIADIYLSGVGFQYPTSVESAAGPAILSVFPSEKPDIHIDRISCEVVYDRVIPDDSPGGPTIRRRRVKFGDFEQEQAAKIEMLLDEVVAPQIVFDDRKIFPGRIEESPFKSDAARNSDLFS